MQASPRADGRGDVSTRNKGAVRIATGAAAVEALGRRRSEAERHSPPDTGWGKYHGMSYDELSNRPVKGRRLVPET